MTDEKKKLAYVLHNIEVGGVEVALISAIPELYRKYDLRIIVLGSVTDSMTTHLTDAEKKSFIEFKYPFYTYPIFLGKIVRFILAFNPDVLICSLWRASLTGILVKSIRPAIKFFSFNHNTRFPHFFSEFFTNAANKKADMILADSVATSLFIHNTIKTDVDIKVVSFITNPTPSFTFSTAPAANDDIRFLFLGRVTTVKNLDLAVRVIQHLAQRSITATLDIYGRNDNGYKEKVIALSTNLNVRNRIRFKGEINSEQRNLLFRHYNFYIQLSSYEGMAMSVVEAMQNGLVCVVSPVGEIAHYASDMKSAVFFEIGNGQLRDEDLDKLCTVITNSDLYNKISRQCHESFLGKKQYVDSLIEQIETGLY